MKPGWRCLCCLEPSGVQQVSVCVGRLFSSTATQNLGASKRLQAGWLVTPRCKASVREAIVGVLSKSAGACKEAKTAEREDMAERARKAKRTKSLKSAKRARKATVAVARANPSFGLPGAGSM